MVLSNMLDSVLQAEKKKIRALVLAQRDAMLPAARAAASHLILEKIYALPQYRQAQTVLTYMGFGSEIETQSFFEHIIADGKTAVLPRVDKATQTLKLHSAGGAAELLTSNWGIREPAATAPLVPINAIDFVLMPGVAFDRSGNRLGYGRGYYDKLIAGSNQAMATVAAAYSCQIIDKVPAGSRDQKVHRIITENEMISTAYDR